MLVLDVLLGLTTNIFVIDSGVILGLHVLFLVIVHTQPHPSTHTNYHIVLTSDLAPSFPLVTHTNTHTDKCELPVSR